MISVVGGLGYIRPHVRFALHRAGDSVMVGSWAGVLGAEKELGCCARAGLPKTFRDNWEWQITLARGNP